LHRSLSCHIFVFALSARHESSKDLPVELVRRIIELAAASIADDVRSCRAQHALPSLALVNHAWEEISRSYLYADIALEKHSQAESLVRTLDLHPDRAALVKKLELSHDPFGEDEP
jgi:hypothetical protein